MSSQPFMKFYPGDFAGDTLGLGATEIGAYMLLLMALWAAREDALPNDDKVLRRIARIDDRRLWKRVRPSVLKFFRLSEDGTKWSHARVTLDKQIVNEVRTQNLAKSLKRWNRGYAAASDSRYQKKEKERVKDSLSLSEDAGARASPAQGGAPSLPALPEPEMSEEEKAAHEWIKKYSLGGSNSHDRRTH